MSNTDNKIKKINTLHTNSERTHYWLFWVKKSKKISFVFFAQFPYDTNPFFVYQQIDSSTTNSNPNNCTDCLSLLNALRWTLYFVHGALNLFFSYYSESTMQFFFIIIQLRFVMRYAFFSLRVFSRLFTYTFKKSYKC